MYEVMDAGAGVNEAGAGTTPSKNIASEEALKVGVRIQYQEASREDH